MSLVNKQDTSPQAIYRLAVARLAALQDAVDEVERFGQWLEGVADADLTEIEAVQADIDALRSAVADARAHRYLYYVGGLPAAMPADYVTGASQRRFIGPR
jgi:hypothetical protein